MRAETYYFADESAFVVVDFANCREIVVPKASRLDDLLAIRADRPPHYRGNALTRSIRLVRQQMVVSTSADTTI